MNFYEEDLAKIHEIGFCDFIHNISKEILKIFHQYSINKGHVVDLGCGTGILVETLSKNNFDVTGVDISKGMLSIAKKRKIHATFIQSSIYDFIFPECVAIIALGECLNYICNDDPRKRYSSFFQKVYNSLLPNGLFIFDVAEIGRGNGQKQRHWTGEDWAILVDYLEDSKLNILTRDITTFMKAKTNYKIHHEIHRLALVKGIQIIEQLRNIGFKAHLVHKFGDYIFPEYYVGVIAHKN